MRIQGYFLGVALFLVMMNFSLANVTAMQIFKKDEIVAVKQVNAGEEVVIILRSNPTTGYSWQLKTPLDEGILSLIRSEYFPSDTPLVGAPGEERWIFKALQKGIIDLSFIYVRSWEKEVPPADRKTFRIIIQEKK